MNDQNGTAGSTPGTAGVAPTPSQEISDLGDILMEKTIDATQSSDFVSVKPNDIDLLASTTTTSDIPQVVATTPQTDSLDLGDISLEDLTKPVETIVAPAVDVPVDLNAIESLSIPEGSSVAVNDAISDEVTLSQTPNSQVIPTDDTINMQQPTGGEIQDANNTIDSVETAPIPINGDTTVELGDITIPVVEETQTINLDTVALEIESPGVIGESQVPSDTQPEEVSTVVVNTQASTDEIANNTSLPIINDVVVDQEITQAPVIPSVNIEEKIAEVKATSEQIQGLDIDSLMAEQPVEEPTVAVSQQIDTSPTVTQTPVANSKKHMGLVLAVLGIVAATGLGYFGYKAMYPVGIDGNGQVGGIAQNTGGVPMMILTGDEFAETGTNIGSGEIMTGDTTVVDTGSVDTTSGTDVGTTIEPTITYDSVVQSGSELANRARKLLIRATIDKNGSARITAFGIQKDIEAFQQVLEKTTDISTVGDVSKIIAELSQRLDSLDQKLYGTKNQ